MNKVENIKVQSLRTGDVLAGSGFRVTGEPQRGLRTPAGKVEVPGFYPGSPKRRHEWRANTEVAVLR